MWCNRLAFAIALSCRRRALAADQIGVVLMHGKQSAPEEHARASPPRSRTPAFRRTCRRCAGPRGASTTEPTAIACANRCRDRPAETERRNGIRGGRTQPGRERRTRLRRDHQRPERHHRARARPSAGGLEPPRRSRREPRDRAQACCGRAAATSRPASPTSTAISRSRSPRRRMPISASSHRTRQRSCQTTPPA